MNTNQHLLLIGDLEQLRSPALTRAVALAEMTRATLHVLICGRPSG